MIKSTCFILIVVLVWLPGCDESASEKPIEEDNGAVSISVLRSSLPPPVVTLRITLTRSGFVPVTDSIAIIDSLTVLQIDDLQSGDWDVEVDALNASGIILYEGSATVTIQPDVITVAAITLSPTSGTLELRITVPHFEFALAFDGIDDYLESKNSDFLEQDSSGTIAFWMVADQITQNWVVPFSYGDIAGSASGSALWVDIRDSNIRIATKMQSTGGSNRLEQADFVFQPDVYYHVAITSDAQIYINGSLLSSYPADAGQYGLSPGEWIDDVLLIGSTENKLYLGALEDGAGGLSHYFPGCIDEFTVWNHVRSESELQNDMLSHLMGNENGLVMYYLMYEGSGQITKDLAGTSDAVLGSSENVESTDPMWKLVDFPYVQ